MDAYQTQTSVSSVGPEGKEKKSRKHRSKDGKKSSRHRVDSGIDSLTMELETGKSGKRHKSSSSKKSMKSSGSFDDNVSDPAMFLIDYQSPPSPTGVDSTLNTSSEGYHTDTTLKDSEQPDSLGMVHEDELGMRPKLSVSYQQKSELAIVGLRNEITMNVFHEDEPTRFLWPKAVQVEAINGDENERIVTQIKAGNQGLRLLYWPKHIGQCTFFIKSQGCETARIAVEISGNNPIVAFCENNDWPVALSMRHKDNVVYIAFMHHVSKYTPEGEYLDEILRENEVHFNDIVVDQSKKKMALSLSGWSKEGTHKFRYQSINMYSLTGTPLWSIGPQHPLFGQSIMRVAFDQKGNLLVASKRAVCTCARDTGTVERRKKVKFGTVSRMSMTKDGHVIIADGNRGHIYVFDKRIKPISDFRVHLQVEAEDENSVVGLSGLSVDHFGHILVSDSLTSSIQVYSLQGTLLVLVDSEWDFVKWPLALAVSKDGHLFVADHGNACVKKFRYM